MYISGWSFFTEFLDVDRYVLLIILNFYLKRGETRWNERWNEVKRKVKRGETKGETRWNEVKRGETKKILEKKDLAYRNPL